MPGDDRESGTVVTMRQRNACVVERGGDRGNTGHHLEGNSCLGQFVRLFAATAEQVRIPTLETDNGPAGLGLFHQQLIQIVLRDCMRSGPLAPVDTLGSGGGQCQ